MGIVLCYLPKSPFMHLVAIEAGTGSTFTYLIYSALSHKFHITIQGWNFNSSFVYFILQSRLSYVTFQGTSWKRSHMIGSLLIQIQTNRHHFILSCTVYIYNVHVHVYTLINIFKCKIHVHYLLTSLFFFY